MNFFSVEPYESKEWGMYDYFIVSNGEYSVVLKKEHEARMVCNMINGMLKELGDD